MDVPNLSHRRTWATVLAVLFLLGGLVVAVTVGALVGTAVTGKAGVLAYVTDPVDDAERVLGYPADDEADLLVYTGEDGPGVVWIRILDVFTWLPSHLLATALLGLAWRAAGRPNATGSARVFRLAGVVAITGGVLVCVAEAVARVYLEKLSPFNDQGTFRLLPHTLHEAAANLPWAWLAIGAALLAAIAALTRDAERR